MNPNYNYDFSKGIIKHEIENEFYKRAGELLCKKQRSSTIVTGPDFKRHIDNFDKYIKHPTLRVCEINTDIFIDIYTGLQSRNDINVLNKSIHLYGSTFIDCDLTCLADIEVIKKTLLKQIETNTQIASKTKVFIFSFSLRSCKKRQAIETILRPIFGLLGATSNKSNTIEKYTTGRLRYKHTVSIHGSNGRIKESKCYLYNAGGGEMLTCFLAYK